MNIYFDNASTTFPKPKIVCDSMYDYLVNVGGNANRSNHSNAMQSNRILLDARETICDFFNYDNSNNVVFTNNITISLNMLLKGSLKPGDHVITTSMEHNSVLRPLYDLKDNTDTDIVSADLRGFVNPENIEKHIKKNTKLIVMSHASNVTGSIQNIKAIGKICKKHNIFFIVDTAQSAGTVKIDMKEINADAIAFTGHKSLLGPQGIGGFIINDKLNANCSCILSGGTGSLSHSVKQPDFLPDKFECGTLNLPGIVGLLNGIEYLKSLKSSNVSSLRGQLLEGLLNIDGFKVYGDLNNENSTSCISFNYKDYDPAEIGFYLEENGIKTRCGLHCAPYAHKTIETFPTGTVRMSLGIFNTKEEVDYTLTILNNLKNNM